MDLHWHIIISPNPEFTPGFTGAVHRMGFDKCIVTGICHYSVILCSFQVGEIDTGDKKRQAEGWLEVKERQSCVANLNSKDRITPSCWLGFTANPHDVGAPQKWVRSTLTKSQWMKAYSCSFKEIWPRSGCLQDALSKVWLLLVLLKQQVI